MTLLSIRNKEEIENKVSEGINENIEDMCIEKPKRKNKSVKKLDKK